MSKPAKLSPAMQRMVRTLELYGNIDPVRDLGRMAGGGTMTSATIVALINRGILREASSRTSHLHFPATTPAQVEADAYAEDDRREAELAAHRADPERWVQTVGAEGEELHYRIGRTGQPVQIVKRGYNFWHLSSTDRDRSAGGTFEEARAAADRVERDAAHGSACDHAATSAGRCQQRHLNAPTWRCTRPVHQYDDRHEYDEEKAAEAAEAAKELAEEEGWGQPDGMMGRTEAERLPAVADVVHHVSTRGGSRPFGRVLLVDEGLVKVEWPDGVEWHQPHELDIHDEAECAPRAATPAEARTGISDRAAAALADVAALRSELEPRLPLGGIMRVVGARLDRIEQALRNA